MKKCLSEIEFKHYELATENVIINISCKCETKIKQGLYCQGEISTVISSPLVNLGTTCLPSGVAYSSFKVFHQQYNPNSCHCWAVDSSWGLC